MALLTCPKCGGTAQVRRYLGRIEADCLGCPWHQTAFIRVDGTVEPIKAPDLSGFTRQICSRAECGKEFLSPPGFSKTVCSYECGKTQTWKQWDRANRPKVTNYATCQWEGCGKEFPKRMGPNKYCGDVCRKRGKLATQRKYEQAKRDAGKATRGVLI